MNVLLAYITDLVVGDPRFLPHPVIYIGKGIEILENILRRTIARFLGLRIAGIFLALIISVSVYYLTYWFLALVGIWSEIGVFLLEIWLISTTVATKSLAKAGMEVYHCLKQNDLAGAREKVGWIVGRDTANLNHEEVTRATVETVAENIVDAIVAPLFYAFLGGAPLAMAYRAINTLDSMVGYKNEKYLEFGWASARLDDLANFLPARLTGILIYLSALLLGLPGSRVLRMILRDARKHPSPNSGFPEAGVAGALGIRLGGLNYYGGKESFRAYMGDELRSMGPEDIVKTKTLMYLVSAFTAFLGFSVTYLWR